MTKEQERAMAVFTGTFMQRIIDAQDKLQFIFNDAVATTSPRQELKVVKRNKDTGREELVEHAVMRRGWKVCYTAKTGLYELLRIDNTDYYKNALDSEVQRFVKQGWIRACDEMQVEKDRKRLARYNRKIDNANEQRNDSLMVHWRRRRKELIDSISSIEESLSSSL
jgi:hypothetical protein